MRLDKIEDINSKTGLPVFSIFQNNKEILKFVSRKGNM